MPVLDCHDNEVTHAVGVLFCMSPSLSTSTTPQDMSWESPPLKIKLIKPVVLLGQYVHLLLLAFHSEKTPERINLHILLMSSWTGIPALSLLR